MDARTAICTWFVADDAAAATHFPQVAAMSNEPAAQAVYWRCSVAFFASSLAVNPAARHLFFTNVRPPVIDGLDVTRWLARNGIETITLPITYRLPPGAVSSWGNQFYVFDVLDYLSRAEQIDRAVVLDSDCLWLRPADAMAAAIDRHGALTYALGEVDYPADAPINGLTRAQMARFLQANGGPVVAEIPYYGGEIYAARSDVTGRIAEVARVMWPVIAARGPDAPCEEAHLLSILYAHEGIAADTAAPFIRRMWTTFRYHDLVPGDGALTVWHLPAEKKTGFADLFRRIAARPDADPRRDGALLGLDQASYARDMGWPRRRPAKLVRDLSLKILEKLGR